MQSTPNAGDSLVTFYGQVKPAAKAKIEIFYGDFIYKNSALDMVSLLKKEISNVNPVIVQVNKKYRVKAKTINDSNKILIFYYLYC